MALLWYLVEIQDAYVLKVHAISRLGIRLHFRFSFSFFFRFSLMLIDKSKVIGQKAVVNYIIIRLKEDMTIEINIIQYLNILFGTDSISILYSNLCLYLYSFLLYCVL